MGLRYSRVCGFELLVIVAHFLFTIFLYLMVVFVMSVALCVTLGVCWIWSSWSRVSAHEMKGTTYLMCYGSKVGGGSRGYSKVGVVQWILRQDTCSLGG